MQSVSLAVGMIDMTWLSAFLLGAGCIALGYLIGARNSARLFLSSRVAKDTDVTPNGKKKNQIKQALEIEKLADILEDFKMVCTIFFKWIFLCTVESLHRYPLKLFMNMSKKFILPDCVPFGFSIVLQVLVVRNDLKMGKGKIAAQCR